MKFFVTTLLVIILGGYVLYESFSQQIHVTQQPINIEGVYKLVSETTTLKKPIIKTSYRKAPEWTGLYNFQKGYFSIVLMDQKREPDWFAKFPKNSSELGFESFAGTYEIAGKNLVLKSEFVLNPFLVGRLRTFEVRTENNALILMENIYPYPENVSEGQRVLVLHKVK